MHVVFDTSVLHKDPTWRTPEFQAVARLARAGHLRIAIPDLVRREFLSHETQVRTAAASGARSNLRSLLHRTLQPAQREALDVADKVLAELESAAQREAAAALQSLLESVGGEVIPFDPSAATAVFEDYFTGNPPFKSPKSRKDIPDGFILEQLRRFAGTTGEVSFLCGDKELGKAAQGIDDVVLFDSVRAFVASNVCQQFLVLENAAQVLPQVEALMESRLAQLTADLKSVLVGREVGGRGLPTDSFDGTIDEVEWIDRVERGSLDHLGKGVFMQTARVHFVCMASFSMSVRRYYEMPPELSRLVEIGDEEVHHNARGSVAAEADIEITVSLKPKVLEKGDLIEPVAASLLDDASVDLKISEIVAIRLVEGGAYF